MTKWMSGAALLTVLGCSSVAAQQTGGGDAAIAIRRFYRNDGTTAVEGVCRVPMTMLEQVHGGPGAFAAYRVTLVVRDSSGLGLTEQSWSQQVPATMLAIAGASSGERFRFALAPGRYTVEVSINDSASGRVTRTTTAVTAFARRPLVSDLVLSGAIRQAEDTVPAGTGEFRRGGFLIAAQTEPVLTPSQTRLFYYTELYPDTASAAQVLARVVTDDGRSVVATRPESVLVAPAQAVTSGVDLAGLPPGGYRLELTVKLGDSAVTRSAPFRMGGFDTEAALARVTGQRVTDVFATKTEAQLDTLYRPLVYIMESGERGIYEGLSVEGKRNYLRAFWQRRDPTPGTPGNEAQDDFYGLVAYATRAYREGGAAEVPGWRTDRGRIFLRYGAPDEVLSRPQASGTQPYEVWKYTHGRLRKFVFYDTTGLGHYELIYTDEQREPSRSDWQELLGREAVEDVTRF
jgi:GWxTD domain-containing protein